MGSRANETEGDASICGEPRESLSAGDVVAGRYVVRRALATGGMGAVYEADHELLGQRIALKVLLPSTTRSPEFVERFVREAQIAAKLTSDHIVRMFDVGVEAGKPYLAMEFLEGEDLSDRAKRGPLPQFEAVGYLLEALDGVIEAHDKGIVHRDLKPSNLFLARRENGSVRVKVLDFGISKLESVESVQLTSSRSMLGSPAYMSPEQIRSTRNVTAQSDVWSLGVILWELLAGRDAFDGETVGDVFAKIREEPLAPITTHRPDLPDALSEVIARATERVRSRRYADAREFLRALVPFSEPGTAIRPRSVRPMSSISNPGMDEAAARSARETAEAPTLADTGQSRAVSIRDVTAATWSVQSSRPARGAYLLAALVLAAVVAAIAFAVTRTDADSTIGSAAAGPASTESSPAGTVALAPAAGKAEGPLVLSASASTSADATPRKGKAGVAAPRTTVMAATATTTASPTPATASPITASPTASPTTTVRPPNWGF